ncbi:flavin reductase [Actinomadura graeca]|uniref:flavin reductase n=1 Tax=Actinomadura graeca TaxID=2750812 RepID=UPI001E58F117|nr:flavin reductase [Actinomadura graeca]
MPDHDAGAVATGVTATDFPTATAEKRAKWWRTVMGEYPTGVCIVSALDDSGRPQGLVVGTFSSVSMDPPLVAFMPMRSSRSYTAVAGCDRFRVSVLGAGHEELCRSFASAAPERRFDVGRWVTDEHGIPALEDAVAWFSCRRTRTIEAGDHDIVLAAVEDLGVGDGSAGMPMLFLKGGYGTFTMPRVDFDADRLGSHLRVADQMRGEVQRLAESIPALVTLCSLAQDRIVVLHASNLRAYEPQVLGVGTTFPFAAPLGVVFAAWGDDLRRAMWRRAGRDVELLDDDLVSTMLAEARERGYAVSLGPAMAERFDEIVSNPSKGQGELRRLWSDAAGDYAVLGGAADWPVAVSSIQVPIFGPDGVPNFALAVSRLPAGLTAGALDAIAARCRDVAAKLAKTIAEETT